jgi:hypothetical protein
VVEIEFLDLFEVLDELHLGEFVVVEFEDLDFLEQAELQAMEVFEVVVRQIQDL